MLFGWLVTWGDGAFFEQERLGTYYDSLAEHLLHGSVNVSPNSIAPEAFVRDGRYYGYFGMTPALFRIPLHLLLPYYDGRWSRLSLMLAAIVSFGFCWWVLKIMAELSPGIYYLRSHSSPSSGVNVRSVMGVRWLIFGFLICAGVGSTLIFLASRSFVYHEAIIWGSALSLAGGYFLFRYLLVGSGLTLSLGGAAAFLAFFARPTAGTGAVLGCLVVGIALILAASMRNERVSVAVSRGIGLPRVARPIDHAAIALAFVGLTIACYFAINYAKFRTFDGVPLRYYLQYQFDPGRMQNTQGHQVHLENIPTCFAAYFGRFGAEFSSHFPWIWMKPSATVFPGARIDINDWASSIPVSMTGLCALAVLGLVALVRKRDDELLRAMRLPIATLGLGGAIVLCTVGICERYLHDFYPFLIFCAAAGLRYLLLVGRGRLLGIATVAIIVLGLVGMYANTGFALEYQRQIVWGVWADKQAQFQDWSNAIDHFFHAK